ncbi:MAG TPA: sel1 repeat family protein, partial [Nitrosomonas sp.]|nr:sel1 repeat family protein [Nitrosomonas sp.]
YHIGQGVNIDNEKSYMWLNLSTAGGYEQAILARDKVARSLNPAQLVQAQKAAKEWLNTRINKK